MRWSGIKASERHGLAAAPTLGPFVDYPFVQYPHTNGESFTPLCQCVSNGVRLCWICAAFAENRGGRWENRNLTLSFFLV